MTSRLHQAEGSIARILAMVPAGKEPLSFLNGVIEGAHQEAAGSSQPMGVVPVAARRKTLASAMATAGMLDSPAAVCARPEGLVDLGVIEWLLRPALLLAAGHITAGASGPWVGLAPAVAEHIARNTCRIDASIAGYGRIQVGSGIRIGERDGRGVIATNAHVVEAARGPYGWLRVDGFELAASYDVEAGVEDPHFQVLAREFVLHPAHDLALLFEAEGSPTDALQGIVLASRCPEVADASVLGVVGHPSFDSKLDPFPKLFGFGDLFGVKRLSPGHVMDLGARVWRGARVEAMLHDATTLSGSSGSCVFDLKTGHLLALHFGGWPPAAPRAPTSGGEGSPSVFEANGAAPLWTLREDAIFEGLDITWR